LTVGENIAFGLRLRKTPKRTVTERVEWAARMLDLSPYLNRRPRELSGGQRQRVAMGRAIVRHPQVFLMDEPLSNLDAKLRVQMRADIAKLQRDIGTTTIYVTHDQVEAMTMGDRVAVMNHGVLQQVDTPQRLYEHPANLFVGGFIGTPPMNLLQADVVADDGRLEVAVGSQRLPVPDATVERYPGLRGLGGRRIVFGVRSDDLHPSGNRPELPTITGQLELVEVLGSQSIAYFKVDAETLRPAAEDVEETLDEEGEGVTAARPNLVASFAAQDALALRIEDHVPVAVDVAKAHFFDESTGEPLR
jgi:multiple sugar transport system ATP-binding protein